MTAPLSPVSSPFVLFGKLGITGHSVALVLFSVVLLFWVIYTLVVIYHWVRYSHASRVATPAIALYLVGSCVFMLLALSGLA